ncbi:HTH_Tnp_Tc3_2 domain-containing protein [Trichonephila clavipes]|nr:HTH_Tnp_Tc3_2 domain-containing protein [Trichonephila clavipes]
MSFARRPGSGRPRQTSRLEDHHIIRNAHVRPTASSATIQAQVAPSLGAPCVFSNHTKVPGGRPFVIAASYTGAALDAHPLTPPFGVVPRTRKLDCSGIEPGLLF